MAEPKSSLDWFMERMRVDHPGKSYPPNYPVLPPRGGANPEHPGQYPGLPPFGGRGGSPRGEFPIPPIGSGDTSYPPVWPPKNMPPHGTGGSTGMPKADYPRFPPLRPDYDLNPSVPPTGRLLPPGSTRIPPNSGGTLPGALFPPGSTRTIPPISGGGGTARPPGGVAGFLQYITIMSDAMFNLTDRGKDDAYNSGDLLVRPRGGLIGPGG